MSKKRVRQANAGRVSAVQKLRASGAAGPHKQQHDRPRAEIDREAIEASRDYDDDWLPYDEEY